MGKISLYTDNFSQVSKTKQGYFKPLARNDFNLLICIMNFHIVNTHLCLGGRVSDFICRIFLNVILFNDPLMHE